MKEKSSTSQKKKILPERKNRGLRMAELAKNEEKMNENDMYKGIFKEDSSDDDFNPEEKNIVDSEQEQEKESNVEEKEDSELDKEENRKNYLSKKKGKQAQVKEVLDIEELDIDRIDFVEDMKDKGIDVSDITDEMYANDIDINPSDEDEEVRLKKKKNQFVKVPKKLKKKKSLFSKNKSNPVSSILIPISDENLKGKDKDKKKKKGMEENIDDSDNTMINRKRKRTNKFESLLKKSKREKLNKNVQILGLRHNPRVISISKKIYLPEEEESANKSNDDKAICFNLEQELDTKSIIKKFKQQEKDKKTFNFQDKIISQQERLLESIFTEWANKNSLKAMQRLDDLNKREATTTNKKSFNNYIKIMTKSFNGNDQAEENINNRNQVSLMFSNEEYYNQMFSYFNTKSEIKEKKMCAITGQPAKYYDPLTKSYYASVEAFKLLREKYYQKEEEGLLFRIQTLSDLASQKKERLKKMILTEDSTNINTNLNQTANNTISNNDGSNNNNTPAIDNAVNASQGMKDTKSNSILNIVNKYGILKNDMIDFDKKVISRKCYILFIILLDRIYNRNRENCLDSGMLLEANKIKLVISKKIFKDKFSSKLLSSTGEEATKPAIASSTPAVNKFF